jgi:DNA-binding transcriptional LysR family regulator
VAFEVHCDTRRTVVSAAILLAIAPWRAASSLSKYISIGELSDSPLIRRRLALLDRGTFASPEYLSRFGTPRTPDDLACHEMVGLLSPDTSEIVPLVFGAGDKTRQVPLPAMVTVTGPETNVACACMGLGLIQVPRYRVSLELAGGALVEVLAGFPPSPLPVHVLYSHTRQLSPRLRVFIDWMAEQFRDRLASASQHAGQPGLGYGDRI